MSVVALAGAALIVVIVVAALIVLAVLVLLTRMALRRRAEGRQAQAVAQRREERAHELHVERERAAVEEKAAVARAERAQAEVQLAHARQVEIEAEQRREASGIDRDGRTDGLGERSPSDAADRAGEEGPSAPVPEQQQDSAQDASRAVRHP